MIKTTTKAHLALLGANVIYGANHLIAKGIMPEKLNPTPFVFFRILGAGLLFWFLKSFIKEKVAKKDFFRLALCGLTGAFANQLFFFNGLSLTSPIDTAIIMTSAPVIVLIFSAFILKEKITKNKLLGLSIGGIGALLLIWYGKNALGTSSLSGNLLIFLNACCFALYLVLVKPLMIKYHFITIISWVFLFGMLFITPFGIQEVINTNYEAFTFNTYLVIAYVVVFTTFLAFLLNIYAINQVAPSVAGSYIYVQPAVSFILVSILTFVFGNKVYENDIGFIKIVSCLLVIVGVFLISKKEKIVSS